MAKTAPKTLILELGKLLIPVVLAYLAYQTAVATSKTEGDSGYKALAQSVKELQTVVEVQGREIAKLQGHQDAWEKMARTSVGPRRVPTKTAGAGGLDPLVPHFYNSVIDIDATAFATSKPECLTDSDCPKGVKCGSNAKCGSSVVALELKPKFSPLPDSPAAAVNEFK